MVRKVEGIRSTELQSNIRKVDLAVYNISQSRLYVRMFAKKYSPCDIEPLEEGKKFFYASGKNKSDCLDHGLAEQYVERYTGHNYSGELTAADLNNVACAYLWKTMPDWQSAEQILMNAKEKDSANTTINSNLEKVHDNNYSPEVPVIRMLDKPLEEVRTLIPSGISLKVTEMTKNEIDECFKGNLE